VNPITSTVPASSEFDLDITFLASGMQASGYASEDCTGDGCGSTNESAGTTC